MAWNKVWPVSTATTCAEVVSGSTEQIRANWDAMDAIMDVEHSPMSSAASGYHIAGHVSMAATGSHTQILALTGSPSGSMAIDSNEGTIWLASGDGVWHPTWNIGHRTRVKVVNFTTQYCLDYQTSNTWNSISFKTCGSEVEDWNSEFNMTSDTFSPSCDGIYLFQAEVHRLRYKYTAPPYSYPNPSMSGTAYPMFNLGLGLFVDGSSTPYTYSTKLMTRDAKMGSGSSVQLLYILPLQTAQTVELKLTHDYNIDGLHFFTTSADATIFKRFAVTMQIARLR